MGLEAIISKAFGFFLPPPKLKLSEWAEKFAFLSAESAADPGKWRNIPYQVGIMDAISDPRIERVTVMKSARVGYTKIIGHAIGYYIHYDPCPIMVVQPTDLDAEGYSKEEVAPMVRDTPVLKELVSDAKSRNSGNTILQKQFPGGTLSLVGANSPRGFRRVSRRVVIFDEVDGYPPSAGAEGDQIKLGIRRTEYYWNRKIVAGSTPTTTALSRIEPMFESGDRRYFHVPCPHCKEFQVLKFPNLKWPDGEPEKAYFVCIHCQKPIDHSEKRGMVEAGKWIPEGEFTGHASFHIWAAYSFSPNATWGQLATEFLNAKKEGLESLKTFINTAVGETWKEKGDAPDWQRLYDRRELYAPGFIPSHEVVFITAGVDVQKDRLELEIVGWGKDKQSWSIDYIVIPGDTTSENTLQELDKIVNSTWAHKETGKVLPLKMLAIDSGYNTQHVYNWVRRHPINKVIAIKGQDEAALLIGTPSAVDISLAGKRIRRGVKLWPVGSSVAKGELYAWLKKEKALDGEKSSPGYCHFPQYSPDYFKQLTSEQLVVRIVKGHKKYQWEKTQDRNEALDCRIYARAAASIVGIDRFSEEHWEHLQGLAGEPVQKQSVKTQSGEAQRLLPSVTVEKEPRRDSWFNNRRR
jgi:terminase, large subunit